MTTIPSTRLEQRILDPHTILEITDEEFNLLSNARKTLVDALAFEQRFEILLSNYIDLEATASRLSLTMRAGIDHTTYLPGASALLEANRLFINLMTAARSYIDQVKQDFKNIQLEKPFAKHASDLLSQRYMECFEYRFMEALRNYSQHKGMPVHSLTVKDGMHDAMSFHCSKEHLHEDSRFKAKVLAEAPASIDLRRCAQLYIEGISNAHVQMRKIIFTHVQAARRHVEAAIERYKAVNDGQAGGLHACKEVNGRREWIGLMVEWDDVRIHLATRNAHGIRFTRSNI